LELVTGLYALGREVKLKLDLTSKIVETTNEIMKKILAEVLVEANKQFSIKQAPIETIAKTLLRRYILNQPEMIDVISGDLQYEFGIIDPFARISNIIDALVLDVKAEVKPFKVSGSTVKGGIKLQGINVRYSHVINMPDAVVITDKKKKIPWLKWLLLEGGNTVIGDYSVELGDNLGRTGGGHMVLGGSYKVPAEFAGTAGNNFITRAIAQMQPELTQEINRCLAA
jgi:hypothetical protein